MDCVGVKREVLPGIEPGLPEDTEVIRIQSDNRYTTKSVVVLLMEELKI